MFNICLVDSKKFRFTFKRIPIYKIYRRYNTIPPYYSSQHQFFGKYNSEDENKVIKAEGNKRPNKDSLCQFIFTSGYFHAYRDLKAAKKAVKGIRDFTIAKGYIPAFTRYAKSFDMFHEICARRIVITDFEYYRHT